MKPLTKAPKPEIRLDIHGRDARAEEHDEFHNSRRGAPEPAIRFLRRSKSPANVYENTSTAMHP